MIYSLQGFTIIRETTTDNLIEEDIAGAEASIGTKVETMIDKVTEAEIAFIKVEETTDTIKIDNMIISISHLRADTTTKTKEDTTTIGETSTSRTSPLVASSKKIQRDTILTRISQVLTRVTLSKKYNMASLPIVEVISTHMIRKLKWLKIWSRTETLPRKIKRAILMWDQALVQHKNNKNHLRIRFRLM